MIAKAPPVEALVALMMLSEPLNHQAAPSLVARDMSTGSAIIGELLGRGWVRTSVRPVGKACTFR